ncbi:MAG TPA: TonB-dependent receptor, partial [Burkholderiales bacterium]|nr:TonB-dependent receptor [Burkholderiales bacterium]
MKINLTSAAAVIPALMGAASAYAANIAAGHIEGQINDALGKPLAAVTIQVQAANGKILASTSSDNAGHFSFANIRPGVYALIASAPDYRKGTAIVTLTATAGKYSVMTLAGLKAVTLHISASKQDRVRNKIDTETGGSSYHITAHDIAQLPQGADTPLNQVLLQAPGVAQDSFGQLHIRGDHANVQYRINNIILPESITGFGQTLDAHFADSITLLTGTLPAEYGDHTAGIVDIHTKTGAFDNGGQIGFMTGSNDTRELSGELRGHQGKLSYFIDASILKNDLGIENPTPSVNAIHDVTTQNKGFGYFSYALDDTSRVSLILGTSDNRFQIPNSPDQTQNYVLNGVASDPSQYLNEQQREITHYGIVALQGTLGAKFDYQISTFSRYSEVMFTPDVNGDLLYTGVASQVLRTSRENGLQVDTSYHLDAQHTIRSGIYVSADQLVNSADILAFPTNGQGVQTGTTPVGYTDNNSKIAMLYGVYAQDEWKPLDKLTINYGLRYDQVDAYVTGNQVSPRLNAVYQLTPSTTVHAGYAHYFTPPPNELISGQTIADSMGTTAAPPGGLLNNQVKPENSDYYDIGLSQQVNAGLTVGIDSYYESITNLLDEGQFGSALLYTPFNYALGKIYGTELTANYRKDNLSAYFNLARSMALGKDITSAQYNFAPGELNYIANNWVHLDHDQRYTASMGTAYLWQGSTYSADALYGSGLRSGFANTSHLPGYTQINVAVSHSFNIAEVGKVDGRISI